MECYNPRMNEWSYVAKMNEPHYGHAGTVYGGLMYISGNLMELCSFYETITYLTSPISWEMMS